MDETRAEIQKMKDEKQGISMQAQLMIGMVEGFLTKFEQASTQKDFDAAAMQVFGMVMQGMGGGPGKSPNIQ